LQPATNYRTDRYQHGEPWHKIHVKEIVLNDVDGTINQNMYIHFRGQERKRLGYY